MALPKILFKRRTKAQDKSIAADEAPWQSCIAVCSKCARKVRRMDGDKTRLRVQLKALIAAKGIKKLARAVDVSCLDVCPENKITVARFSPQGTEVINVGPHTEAEQILKQFKL